MALHIKPVYLTIIVAVSAAFVSTAVFLGTYCGGKCSCSDGTMLCSGRSIARVPQNVTHVQLIEANFEQLKRIFEADVDNWSRVTHLTVHSLNSSYLPGRTFQSLNSLVYLKIHCETLNRTDASLFYGLDLLKTLDLSSNSALDSSYISRAFLGEQDSYTVLKRLETLNLSYIGQDILGTQNMDEHFYTNISRERNIRYLDISGINIQMFETGQFHNLCQQGLEHLVLRDTKVAEWCNCYTAGLTCPNLHTLNLDGLRIASGLRTLLGKAQAISPPSVQSTCGQTEFYYSIRTLRVERIFESEKDFKIYLGFPYTDIIIKLEECIFELEHIHLSGNAFKFINITNVELDHMTRMSVKTIDISHNGLSYIAPGFLGLSSRLLCLNFSNNELYKMQRGYPNDFASLFHALAYLQELRLADNGLVDLPQEMFSKNTNLAIIDLSMNKLNRVSFEISSIIKLHILNLSNNNILRLDSSTYNHLKGQEDLSLILNDNPFICDCNIITSHLSDLVSLEIEPKANKIHFNCSYDGVVYSIGSRNIVDQLKENCLLQTTNRILMMTLPTGIIFIVSVITTLVLLRNRKLKRDGLQKIINKIRLNELPFDHLVFLCFASDDHEVVENHVYVQMDAAFREIIGVDREFVCKGDSSFRPGFHIINETARCVEKCAVVVAAVSNTFCQRHWCEKEMMHGYNIGKPIVLIMLENIERKLMPEVVARSFNTFVHAALVTENNETKAVPSWPNMCKSIIELAGKENHVGDDNTAFHVLKGHEDVCAANHVQNI